VISNNIANMRTTGYKRQRAEFQDLLYEHVRRVGTQTSDQGNHCRPASSSARA
jgi:flagellar basal-body rod protein FlgG